MPKANEIKKGTAVELNGKILMVKDIEVSKPSARGASTLYRFCFTDLATGGKVDERFKADEMLDTVDMFKRKASFSYVDGEEYIFMDTEDFSQYTFNHEDIADELLFINEETQGLQVVIVNDKAAALELPSSVELVIEETDPSIKGASASARTKPARFATGLTVQVPEYIATGDRVVVNTTERKYMNRA